MGHQWHSGVADAMNETHLQSIREKLVEHPEAAAVAAQAERLGRQAIQPAEASECVRERRPDPLECRDSTELIRTVIIEAEHLLLPRRRRGWADERVRVERRLEIGISRPNLGGGVRLGQMRGRPGAVGHACFEEGLAMCQIWIGRAVLVQQQQLVRRAQPALRRDEVEFRHIPD